MCSSLCVIECWTLSRPGFDNSLKRLWARLFATCSSLNDLSPPCSLHAAKCHPKIITPRSVSRQIQGRIIVRLNFLNNVTHAVCAMYVQCSGSCSATDVTCTRERSRRAVHSCYIELVRLNLMSAPFDIDLLLVYLLVSRQKFMACICFQVEKFISVNGAVAAACACLYRYLFIIDASLLYNCIRIPCTDNKTVG